MLNKLKTLRKNEEGFTLIELMVVVLIIGILAAIAIPVFLNLQAEAVKASVRSDVKNTVTVVATYLAKDRQAPESRIRVDKTGPVGVALGSGAANIAPVVTHDGTTITVYGDWDSYRVAGVNYEVPGAFALLYNSTNGTYTS